MGTVFISRNEAKTILQNHKDGTIFTATFLKRTNGEKRVMNCRKGVKKGQNGGGLKFNPASKGLLPVFDMQKCEYRFISLERITEIKMRGTTYVVR